MAHSEKARMMGSRMTRMKRMRSGRPAALS